MSKEYDFREHTPKTQNYPQFTAKTAQNAGMYVVMYVRNELKATALVGVVSVDTPNQGGFEAERALDETARSGWCDLAETARTTYFGTFESKSYPLARTKFSRV